MKAVGVPLIVCCLSLSVASPVRPSFNPRDVVRHLRSSRPLPSAESGRLPALDGEFLVDTGGTYVPAPDNQAEPALASDGENFLVVWSDSGSAGAYNIYGARVTSDGELLDPAGFVVSSPTLNPYRPTVAFDGGNFLVVWETYPNGGYSDIYGARVTPAGVVLDTDGIAISTADWWQVFAAVAFDGTNYLVTWENSTDDSCYICGARVTPAGIVLDTAGIRISTAAGYQACPAISFDGTDFLVAWMDTRNDSAYDIYGARVTPAGVLLDTTGIAICPATGYQWYPALAFDGSNYLAEWGDARSGSSCDVYAARITPQGEVLDPSGIAITRSTYNAYVSAVAYDGDNFLVTWQEYSGGSEIHLRCTRVTRDGLVRDPAGIVILRAVNYAQDCPAVGFDGASFLVVWQDSTWGISGARVTPEGTMLDPAGFLIAQTGWTQSHPVVAFGGTNYLVVWQDSCGSQGWNISGARVTPQGEVLDSPGFAIAQAGSDQWLPAVTSDGTNCLVVWQDDRSGNTWANIRGARVSPDGTVLDSAGIVISNAAHDQGHPAAGFDGFNYLVVWQDGRSGTGHDIYGTPVTRQGKVLGDSGFIISQSAADQYTPAISFDGANYLVVWQDGRSDVDHDIYGARVTPQTVVLDTSGIAMSTAAGDQNCPAPAFDGTNYFVVWQSGTGGDWDIDGTRVSPAGTVFDGGAVVSQRGDQLYPSLCSGGDNMLLAYQAWTDTVGGKVYDADRIWGKMDPDPAIAEMPSAELLPSNGATILRGVLVLDAAEAADSRQQAVDRAELRDVAGRAAMKLQPGANDVRALAPGVYFIRGPKTEDGRPGVVRKVIVTR